MQTPVIVTAVLGTGAVLGFLALRAVTRVLTENEHYRHHQDEL